MAPHVERVSAEEAYRLANEAGYVFLDVRSVPEFELGHAQGAFNIPWQQQAASGMVYNDCFSADVQRCFERERARLLVICQSGTRSLLAAQALCGLGYRALDVAPGMTGVRDPFGRVSQPGYVALGFPVAMRAELGRTYLELLRA